MALAVGVGAREGVGVVLPVRADEHPGPAAAQRHRVDARPLQRLPRQFQQQPLLRVHRQGLARGHLEEVGVEPGDVGQEPADPGEVPGQAVDVPAAVGGEGADDVAALDQQPPQVLRRVDAAGEAAGHADDGDRVVGGARRGVDHLGGQFTEHFAEQVLGERDRGRVVERQRRGQPQVGGRGDPVAQLDRGQRVEAQPAELAGRFDALGRVVAQHRRGLGPHEVDQRGHPLPGGERRQPRGQRAAAGAGPGRGTPAGPGADQAAQQGGHLHRVAHGGQVQARGHAGGVPGGGVEQGQALLGRQCAQAPPAHPVEVDRRQRAGHARPRLPQAPGHGRRREAAGGAVRREGVEERVARGVVALPRRAHGARDGGAEDEPVQVGGQLVQVPGRVDLHRHDPAEAFGGEGVDHAVVDRPGGVHHAAQRVLGGHRRQRGGQGRPVGDVAGQDGRGGTSGGQVGHQLGGALSLRSTAAEQQQVPHPVFGDQVAGEEAAQVAEGAGDQHRAVGVPRRGGGGLGPHQPRRVGPAVAHDDLRFVGDHRVAVVLDVHQPEAARVLRLRGPHQAPHGRGGRVDTADRPPRDEHQPGVAALHQFQRPRRQRVGGCHDVVTADQGHHGDVLVV
ncbi:hypothetical protein UO65_5304 [Actinokineospora spheciospongiae]|uniref:Uncharacterized protein n=1 Tax=Actinokineospora spheciospongiae TaxID=909613 RepID=W7IGD4_9PSEU|nr:hypothetical protein UO65_5304 [Actinokineospora spheciospongiae]